MDNPHILEEIEQHHRHEPTDMILATYLRKRLAAEAASWGVPWSDSEQSYSKVYLSEVLLLQKGFHVDLSKMLSGHMRSVGSAPPYEVSTARVRVSLENGSEAETMRVVVFSGGKFEKTSKEVFDDAVRAAEAIIALG